MARIDDVKEQYSEAVEALFGSLDTFEDSFQDFLDFSCKMYKMPFSDSILLFHQNPEIEMAADLKTWNNLGRRVKRGAKAVVTVDEIGKLKYLYDVSQTVGRPLTSLWTLDNSTAKEITERLSQKDNYRYSGFNQIIDKVVHDSFLLFEDDIMDNIKEYGWSEEDCRIYINSLISSSRYVTAGRCEYRSENIMPLKGARSHSTAAYSAEVIQTPDQFILFCEYIQRVSQEAITEIYHSYRELTVSNDNARKTKDDKLPSPNNTVVIANENFKTKEKANTSILNDNTKQEKIQPKLPLSPDGQLSFFSDDIEIPSDTQIIDEVDIEAAIQSEIMRGSGFIDGKFRINDFYNNSNPNTKDFAAMLKKEYGIGGHSGDGVISFVNHDSKGIMLEIGDRKISFTWNSIAERISKLIDNDEYITQHDIDERIRHAKYILNHNSGLYDSRQIEEAKAVLNEYGLLETINSQIPVFEQESAENVESPEISEPVHIPSNANYAFDPNNVVSGGAKTKFRANFEAIETLKKIESEHRSASAEEQSIMARYVGWGGISQAFDPNNIIWRNEYLQLKELLSDDEYSAARASTRTSFYTPPEVIDGIYQALKQFGFEGGNILEPSMGIGNFFAKIPESMSKQSKLYGIELDSISGRIAQQLYPKANIQIKGFEKTHFNDNSFDVVIGNIPFGDYTIADKKYNKYNFSIHDYFTAKSIDQVKPGGIVAIVTSKFTMDKQNPKIRKYIAERCELLGAVRLPNNAFKESSGTETTTDILFLRKRENMTIEIPYWVDVDRTADGIECNRYFVRHPEMILGKMVRDERMIGRYGESSTATTCLPDSDSSVSLKELISKAIANIHGEISVNKAQIAEDNRNTIPADPTVRNFTHTLVDGELYFRENEIMTKVRAEGKTLDRMIGLHKIREAEMKLISSESRGCSDEKMIILQGELNRVYDKFTQKYGYINDRSNANCFKNDDDFNTICALEIIDKENNTVLKAPIFYKRTIKPIVEIHSVDTAQEAMLVSLDHLGKVDIQYMAKLTNSDPSDVIKELGNSIFRNPVKIKENDPYSGYEDSSEYLSGNVRAKLRTAKAFAKSDTQFERNVEALEKVIPELITAEQISVRISTPWIEIDDYNLFFAEYAHESTRFEWDSKITRTSLGEYKFINGKRSVSTRATEIYGTSRLNSYAIFERLLNQREIVVKDAFKDENGNVKYVVNDKETRLAREKARQMEMGFKDWIWADINRREKYVEKYNELFNCIVGREYDGSHQSFDGMNPDIKLRKHQLDAVMRGKLGGNELLAHVVGAGKSFEMIAITMEKRRLGLINKACVTVPKALTEQMGIEWVRLYPNAKILVARQSDFTKDNRQRFIARCATGDYDAIIMSHEQFGKIPMSDEYINIFIHKQLDQLENNISSLSDSEDRVSVKALERQKAKLEAKLEKLLDSTHDNSLCFEKLGFDFLVCDEAHMFKNCFVNTKMGNVAGVQTSAAQKSEDMLMKCDYLNYEYGCNNIVFATGTPISNSMVELYVMQRYLRPDLLKEAGVFEFDDWAATFGQIVTKLEPTPDGSGFRSKKRFAKFVNLPELLQLFKEFADIKTQDMLNLDVPKIKGGEATIVVSQPDNHQRIGIENLAARSEDIHSGMVKPWQDNMLKITGEARLLGLDSRCMFPEAEYNPDSKIASLVNNVINIYKEKENYKGVQVVFCDIAINSDNGKFSAYDEIKRELIKNGIPEIEICFAGDAKNEKQRKQQHEELRRGDKRVVIGSTSKLGTGVNIQDRLCAIHHLDIAWKPSDFEQRNGRGVRQGNMFDEIEIFHYVTQDTFDMYMMETVVRKSKFTNQIMTSRSPARTCEDVDDMTLTYSRVQAATTSNPLIAERIELDSELQTLRLLKSLHTKSVFKMQELVERDLPQKISKYQILIKKAEKDKEIYKSNKPSDFNITIGGKIIEDRQIAVNELEKARQLCISTKESILVGKCAGFDVRIEENPTGSSFFNNESPYLIAVQGNLKYTCGFGENNGIGNTKRIENLLSKEISIKADKLSKELSKITADYEEAKIAMNKPFEREEELQRKEARLAFLNDALSKDKKNDIFLNAGEEDDDQYDDSEEVMVINHKTSSKSVKSNLSNKAKKNNQPLDCTRSNSGRK